MHRALQSSLRVVLWLCLLAAVVLSALTGLLLIGSKGSVGDLFSGNRSAPIHIVDRGISQPQDNLIDDPPFSVQISLDPRHIVARTDRNYLSFALDAAQVTGAPWWKPEGDRVEANSGSVGAPPFDFQRPGLDILTAALSPAYLRIGGSEADRIWYAMDNQPKPAKFSSVLTRSQWDQANNFALRAGLQIVFTLNAGPGPRHKRIWDSSNARSLIAYTAAKDYPVAVWEYGNELNGFWFIHGLGSVVSARSYARELTELKKMVAEIEPSARIAGQGSAFWPVIGEPFSTLTGFTKAYLQASAKKNQIKPDIVMWHYYPQQSRRSPVATRRAAPGGMLDPHALDEAAYWSKRVNSWAQRLAPNAEVWLGETGNAQFGGEPGVSDRWVASLWWLDQLGLLARQGTKVMIRQTLTGGNYGMLDRHTLSPLPDYWVSVLWKRLMGTAVLAPQADANNHNRLRVYAHQAGPASPKGTSITLLLINLDPRRSLDIHVPVKQAQAWFLNAPDVLGTELGLNGKTLVLGGTAEKPVLPNFDPITVGSELNIRPLSVAFVSW